MFQTGYYTIGQYKGVPIRVHWSIPLGALFFGGLAFRPGFWLGFFGLILWHEVGHAMVVRACRLHVGAIDIHGFGGLCRWQGSASRLQVACIAWGGVWAQLALFAAMQVLLLFWAPTGAFAWDLVAVWTTTNLWLAGLNLIPVRPLDGADAWPLFRLLWERHKMRERLREETEWRASGDDKKGGPPEPKYSDRVVDPNESETLFNRLMDNSPVVEEEDERK